MENLVALIRKVEAHPDTALWTMGKMASTLIHRYCIVLKHSALKHTHIYLRTVSQNLKWLC